MVTVMFRRYQPMVHPRLPKVSSQTTFDIEAETVTKYAVISCCSYLKIAIHYSAVES